MRRLISTKIARRLAAVVACLLAANARAAGPFTVNNTGDSHVVNTNTGVDGSGHITLRSAIEAANFDGGATVNVPAGTYNLTLGELEVATNGGESTVIQASGGATSANTFIAQTDASNRVFNIDSNSVGNTQVTLSGFTIQGGFDKKDNLGGAGILAGGIDSPVKDSLALTGCVIQNNHCVEASAGYTANPGGGVQMAGGDLLINGCTFLNNSSAAAFGGAIFFYNQSNTCFLNISNSLFINNRMTNDSGSGPDGGGAIMIGSTAASAHVITNCTFTGNQAIGTAGNTYGGAIQMNGGTINVESCLFTNNTSTANGAQGGALYADSGSFNLIYCRFINNSATNGGNVVFNHTSNGATSVVDNNWWALNTGPASADLSGATTSAYLRLNHYATPNSIATNGSTTLTASVLTNSAGSTISLANLNQLIGLPITFNNAIKGTLSAAQTSLQSSGTATATFTAIGIPGPASANATIDSATSTAPINIQCPTITGTVSGGGGICAGSSGTVMVTLSGGVSPYLVTLNNGGGFKVSASPVILTVTPSSNTTYSVSAASDTDGCTANVSGTAAFTINPLPVPTISLPAMNGSISVCGNSTGNTASGPAGMSGYAWRITNGVITSSTTVQTISFTAGGFGTVGFGLTVTNASGCTSNGAASVAINPVGTVVITASPPSVSANVPGNVAMGPSGMSAYAWTITNGFITSSTNGLYLTYVAGAEGVVELGLTVLNSSGCVSVGSLSVPIIQPSTPPAGWSFRSNYFASFTFSNELQAATMPMAFDGTSYWSTSGNSTNGVRLAQYNTNGVLVASYSPGLDFRSVFTDANGVVLARQYSNSTIYLQTSPGVFVPSGVTLAGSSLNSQASVVLNGAGTEYDAVSSGVVSRWDTEGNFLGTVNLQGYGSLTGETTGSTQARGLAAFGNFWLTYNGAGMVSVWDTFGNRLFNCILLAAGTSGESDYSFSYCNGKVFIVDSFNGSWRGYDLGSLGQVAIYGAPTSNSWNADVQSKILATGSIPKVDTNIISGTNPVPTLTNLVRYESVLVYSDSGFSDPTNLGNALAAYIQGGGGVAIGTFAYETGLDLLGAMLTNNYLPFAIGSQAEPGNLTLVEDVPTHQIFNGVTSFNGGTASFQNTTVITNGATLIGHWSNGQPLLGVKDIAPGRIVGFNFYAPSSNARTDFWAAATSGGPLMANSLLWAGRVPPIIATGPTNFLESPGKTVNFNVTATGLPPLTYQWRRNGTILPGATNASFSFTYQNNSNGIYNVIVSNSYGIAVSETGNLGSPVLLYPVIGLADSLSLKIAPADGTALTAYRASRISLYTTTNVAAPFSTWVLASNPLLLSNGVLWAQGLSATNSRTFYRASEMP